MSYELLDEDEKSYKLKHPKGHEMVIAKQAISDAFHERIRGLAPKKMAKGGVVNPFEDLSTSRGDLMTPANEKIESYKAKDLPKEEFKAQNFAESMEYGLGQLAKPFIDPFMSKSAPGEDPYEQALTSRIEASRAPSVPQAPPPGVATIGKPPGDSMPQVPLTVQPQVPIGGEATSQVPIGQPQGAGVTRTASNPIQDIERGMSQAVKLQSQTQQQMSDDTLKAQEEANKKTADVDRIYNDELSNLNKQSEALFKASMEQKIDPRRLISNASTGGKIAAGIGLLLGGIGSGLTGGPNQALAVINKMVDQDIDAQKADMGKTQNLYSMNLQKTRDANAAYALTKAQIGSWLQGQVSAAAARAGTPLAKAQEHMALAKIKEHTLPLWQQAAQQQTVQAVTKHIKDTGDFAYADLLPEKEKKEILGRAVPGYGMAMTEAGAQKLKPMVAAHKVITSNLDILKDMAGENFNSLSLEQRDKAKVVMTDTLMSLKNLYELGVLSGPDKELIDDVLKNPSSAFEVKTFKKLGELQGRVDARLDASLVSENIRPPKRIKEKQLGGKK